MQTVDPRVDRAGPALAASNPGAPEGGAPRRLCARRSHNNFPKPGANQDPMYRRPTVACHASRSGGPRTHALTRPA
jgi:hypothetical protein